MKGEPPFYAAAGLRSARPKIPQYAWSESASVREGGKRPKARVEERERGGEGRMGTCAGIFRGLTCIDVHTRRADTRDTFYFLPHAREEADFSGIRPVRAPLLLPPSPRAIRGSRGLIAQHRHSATLPFLIFACLRLDLSRFDRRNRGYRNDRWDFLVRSKKVTRRNAATCRAEVGPCQGTLVDRFSATEGWVEIGKSTSWLRCSIDRLKAA